MRRVVVVDDLREFEIRPQDSFEQYVRLIRQDAERILAEWDNFDELVNCPACGQTALAPAFPRLGFQYVRCPECRSLYVSPRPTDEMLHAFYAESKAVEFWSSTLAHQTAHARQEHIFQPRAVWIIATAEDNGCHRGTFVDYHSKYKAFLDEMIAIGKFDRYVAIAPQASMVDNCVQTGFTVTGSLPDGTATVVSAQEVIERVLDPMALLRAVNSLLEDGGLLFMTTLTSSGFDVQVLGAHAKNPLPPTHLNVLSVEGMNTLVQRSGFDILELSTPGQLDTEIVAKAVKDDPTIVLPPLIDDLIRRRDEHVHRVFQEFLQQACLSSHLRLVARKRKVGCLSLDGV